MSALADYKLKNPMQDALENWDLIQSELKIVKDSEKELVSINAKLLAEVDYLREKLDQVSTERDRYKTYAVEITTRLQTIKETILAAEAGAREYAMRPPVPNAGAEMAPHEIKEVEALVGRLPKNAW